MNDRSLILLVEDDQNDVLLIRRGLTAAGIQNPCHHCPNGEDAIDYLKGEGRYENRTDYPLPALILLDLKLPGKDGFEVLHWIRTHTQFEHIRVVVTTVSTEIRHVNRAYQLGANSFLTKPLEFENPEALLSTLGGEQFSPPQFTTVPIP